MPLPENVTGEKLPAQSLEAEQALIGACLLDPEAWPGVVHSVEESDFYSSRHGVIWKAIRQLASRREPVDVVTVNAELERLGELQEVGGGPYLASLINAVAVTSNVNAYAKIVIDCAVKRNAQRAIAQLAADGYDDSVSADDYVQRLAGELSKLIGARRGNDGPQQIVDHFSWLEARYEAWRNGERVAKDKLTHTGLILVDHFAPLAAGDLVVVAGRPGMGKTQIARELAVRVAKRDRNNWVFWFSLEMDREDMHPRLLAAETGIEIQKLRVGDNLTEGEWSKSLDAAVRIASLPIAFDDKANCTSENIYAKSIQKAAELGRPRLIIVDYLQLLTDRAERGQTTNDVVGRMTRNMKLLAKELKVPVLLLSQITRGVESREDKKPLLSDLRSSGNIEQDADAVWLLYRPDYYDPRESPGMLQIAVAKQRQGPTFDMWFEFERASGKINEIEPKRWPKLKGD